MIHHKQKPLQPDHEVWSLVVIFSTGDSMQICASEHACKTAHDRWTDSITKGFEVEGEDNLIEIEGFTDSADRAPRKMAFLADQVKCVSTWRLY